MEPTLVISSSGAGRNGQKHPHFANEGGNGHSDRDTQLEQEYGWKRELFAPESSHERKARQGREHYRAVDGPLGFMGAEPFYDARSLGWAWVWAEKYKNELRGTLPSFGRKLH